MKKIIFIISLTIYLLPNATAKSLWSIEFHGGTVYNIPVPLTISQGNYPNINFTARYRTDAFEPPVYWNWRLSRWQKGKSWELELIHHKLYLDNISAEVQKFNISHGFNMLFVNRGFAKRTFRYRAGAGIVLSHPESKIRGKEFGNTGDDLDLGYFVSGPALNLAVGKPIRIGGRFYLDVEAKTTLAYSYIKVAQGHAEVYNLAFHLIFGLGVDFIKP